MQRNQYLEDNLLKCLKPVEKNGLRPYTYLILLYNKIDRGNALKKTLKFQGFTFLCFLTIRIQYIVVLEGTFKT